MAKPLMSIVIPAYNEEKFIGKCVDAISRQTVPRKDYEIIVVDAKSRDKTIDVAKKAGADKVVFEKHMSIGGARGDGADVAAADIIVTADADATPPENWLARIKEDFDKNPDVICFFGPQKPDTRMLKVKILFKVMGAVAWFMNKLGRPYLSGGNSAFRKEAYKKAGGFANISLGEDIELGWRLKRIGKVRYDGKMLTIVSDRRFVKHGVLGTVFAWKIGELQLLLKYKKPGESYASQEY
ncbi:Glycosyltransferase AglE [Candidatus Gugararchaeum adminiculabundum]|nr:Glycosyltransferase AglE [Candidatus Gugararchaeum adminiculabundum]